MDCYHVLFSFHVILLRALLCLLFSLHSGTHRYCIHLFLKSINQATYFSFQLVLYNDVEDDGTFLGQNGSVQVPISNFTWSAEVLQSPSHQVAVMLQTTHYQNVLLPNNTRLSVQVWTVLQGRREQRRKGGCRRKWEEREHRCGIHEAVTGKDVD